jgi:hypothetical protein
MTAGVDIDGLTLAEAAALYAELGLPVFPCRHRGKEPVTPHGPYDASNDVEAVRRTWREKPGANIGLALFGLVLVDLDPRNGAPSRDELLDRTGGWPATAEAISGSGGRHLYFRALFGRKPPSSLGPGIDVKSGPGSYAILPPSIHPEGGVYRWDGADPISDLRNLPPAPEWVYARGREERQSEPAGGGEPIPKGRRNETLFRLAASLRAKGLSQAAVLAALLAENSVRCQPPLPEAEVRRIAESAARYPAGNNAGGRQDGADPDGPWVRPQGGVDPSRVVTPSAALEVLNSLTIWKSLRWSRWQRRGEIFIGTTECGSEVRIPGRKLGIFETAYSEILASTGTAIRRPKRGMLRAIWGDVAELIHKAASADVVQVSPPEQELRCDMIRCFELAGCPAPADGEQLFAVLSALRGYVRAPHEPHAPPCVFLWDGRWHVKLDVLKVWLSTPVAAATFKRIDELEQAASLLGFNPHHEQLSAQQEHVRIKLRTWSGAIEVLVEE